MNGVELLQRVKKYNKEIKTIALSGQEKADIVVESYSRGADKYIIKNDKSVVELLQTLKTFSENISLRQEVESLREQIIDRSKYEHIIGERKALLKVLRLMQKVEKSNILVLITGESGTGKEVVASTNNEGTIFLNEIGEMDMNLQTKLLRMLQDN